MDLIKIFDNIYISNDCNNIDNKIKDLNITNIINIDNTKQNADNYDMLNISSSNINYDLINQYILKTINNNKIVLLCDINYTNIFYILCAFIIKILNMPYTYTINYIYSKLNFDMSVIDETKLFNLFEYFKNK
jgi:hypothetical protein